MARRRLRTRGPYSPQSSLLHIKEDGASLAADWTAEEMTAGAVDAPVSQHSEK